MKRYKEISTVIIITTALFAGIFFRGASGFPLIQSELIYATPEDGKIPEPDSPAAAVKRFYLLFDRGMYEMAWEICLEPDWSGDRKVRYQDELLVIPAEFAGWTGLDAFVERCMDDLGPGGIYLSLSHLKTKSVKSSIDKLSYEQIRNYPGIKAVYKVRATGDFLASCAVYRWKKDLFVLETEAGYKVLLEGIKASRELIHMNWLNFSEKQLIRELRSQ